jgi:hydroxyacylglutathione hydrolase
MIHILRLTLPNVYLITGEKAILVDAGGPKDVPRILAFLQAHGIGAGKLSLILLTHGHWDHAGGAAQLKAATGAPVAIHRADADLVRRGINGPLRATNLTARLLCPFLDKSYPPIEPDLLIDDEIDLTSFGVAARILLTPGHTPGSISVLTAAGEMLVGDLLMGGYFGGWLFPKAPGLHYYADDLTQLHASIRKVLAASPNVIHPGHGGPLDPVEVARRFGAARINAAANQGI